MKPNYPSSTVNSRNYSENDFRHIYLFWKMIQTSYNALFKAIYSVRAFVLVCWCNLFWIVQDDFDIRVKLKLWSQDMDWALTACIDANRHISAAARMFNVPQKTRIALRCEWSMTVPGEPTALSAEHELSLCTYIDYMASRGFPLTVAQILMYSWCVDRKSGRQIFGHGGPCYGWRLKLRPRPSEAVKLHF